MPGGRAEGAGQRRMSVMIRQGGAAGAAGRPRRREDGEEATDVNDGATYDDMGRGLIKPDDQLQLTDQELKEELTRILTANNPHAPQNIVRYSFKDRQYKQVSAVDQLAVHFQVEGNLIHKESEEAKRQLASQKRLEPVPEVMAEKPAKAAEEGEEGEAPRPSGEKMLRNQFNFTERAAQTYNNPLRERGTVTEPPPRVTISGSVSQWEIYDAYQEDFERNQEKTKEKKVAAKKDEEKKKRAVNSEYQSDDMNKIAQAAKIVERMVNQNTYDEIAQDFKYFEDASDEHRGEEGTLLPLWKFSYDKAKKLAVTALSWSPIYMDLFAVGLGSYEFLKPTNGMVLVCSLKNPSYPEYIYPTENGVVSLQFHPTSPQLLCIGFYDGNVGIINLLERRQLVPTTNTVAPPPNNASQTAAPATSSSNGQPESTLLVRPTHMSNARTGKHSDPVWSVRWQKDDLDGNKNFISCSSDGRILHWTLIKNELLCREVLRLKLPNQPGAEKEAKEKSASADSKKEKEAMGQSAAARGPAEMLGSATALDFHRTMDYLFLTGTEEGRILKCSKAYASEFLGSYEGHLMPVYKVSWNRFHPNVFASCSADWTVKVWDHTVKNPVFSFDLGSPVGDVSWAPYSSTVFAAVTTGGKVYVFDLNVNKYEPLCEQAVVSKKKAKLTHISFNNFEPILIVGDDRGNVMSLKLSPNLRKQPKDKKGIAPPGPAQAAAAAQQPKTIKVGEMNINPENEQQKMERLLQLVKDAPASAPTATSQTPAAPAAAAAPAKKE